METKDILATDLKDSLVETRTDVKEYELTDSQESNTALMGVLNTIEMLSDKVEHDSLLSAFEDIRAGRVRSLDEIDAELEKQ